MAENPGYYAIIPASVRYDKTLKANEKLLYAEISALSNKNGYCWATNSYLSDLYGVSKRSVTTWLKELEDRGYIKMVFIKDKGSKTIKERRIYLAQAHESSTPVEEKFHRGIEKNFHTPIEENFQENNTSINTTSMNKIMSSSDERDAILYSEIVDYLNEKAGTKFRSQTKDTQKHIKARVNEGFTFNDFKKVIDTKTSQWLNDPKMNAYLRPATLFGTKFEGYLNEQSETGDQYEDLGF